MRLLRRILCIIFGHMWGDWAPMTPLSDAHIRRCMSCGAGQIDTETRGFA